MNLRQKLLNQPTLAEFFLTSASLRYGKTAYITKDEKGRFRVKTTYGQLMDRAFRFASALVDEGYKLGDIAAVMSNPALEFSVTDLGATMIGAVTGGIYVTDSSELLEYKLNHLEARIFIIENTVIKGMPQLAKVLRIPRKNMPHLKKIVVIGKYDPVEDDRLVPFEEFANNATNMEQVSEMVYQVEPEMPAVIIYSSGTEGRPKGAILTHHNIMSNIRQADSRAQMEENKRYMDFLPPAHVFGYMVRRSVEGLGATIYVSHRDTLADDLPMVSPHIIAGVPKFFMALADRIRARVSAMGVDVNNLQDMQKSLILRAAGLHECEVVISGAAAIPDETVSFFKDKLGFRIDQAYGVTETSPGITSNTADEWKLGTVGKPFDGVDIMIVDNDLTPQPTGAEGEIAVSGDNVFLGYFKDEEKTRRVLKTIGGKRWYLTGDVGIIDEEGFLRITDRKDDMLVPISGENVSSTSVENKLTLHSRYVGFAVPYGTRRDFVTAVIWSDETKFENIIADARAAGIESVDALEIQADPKFAELLDQDLRRVLEVGEFNTHERPKGFVYIVNPGEEEVTSTLKARKKAVRKKFERHLIELYETKAFLKIVKQ
jgi:long-chain acyl-CoA synthetase